MEILRVCVYRVNELLTLAPYIVYVLSVCMCVGPIVYVCVDVCTYRPIRTCMYIGLHMHDYTICISMHTCIYVCIHACM